MVHLHHWNRSGFSIGTRNADYQAQLRSARFCLAPTGGGHGHRQVLVAFAGCVPLLIGDFVHQPFEPELDWARFSVSARQADIPTLHETLSAITPAAHAALRSALPCAAQHLSWSSVVGGFMRESGRYDAFETLLEVLRARIDHPGIPPHRLADEDPQLAAFMECRDEHGEGGDSQGDADKASAPVEDLATDDLQSTAAAEAHASAQQHVVVQAGGVKGGGGSSGGGRGDSVLCSISSYDVAAESTACKECTRKGAHALPMPGGVPCCGAASLAECARPWP
uniref:Exostosin GT47 domain-containing protein n=1 Tax=Chlamydomonas euryale TaxID=1486919 RepID=A0A6U2FL05_9CHLO|mmetsp:Transcript_29587/g.87514  ORF Transcript_29587/g.87514 Transcript_29587/m.87514 type:complete len:281 (+) Transcript_29587:608-1450(+)